MKVHPVSNRPNIPVTNSATICKLRRLPHIFSKVLELPFYSNTNVSIQETPESLKFIVDTDIIDDHIAAHTIEIFPGVTKVIVRSTHNDNVIIDNEMEAGLWRFRLPEDTQPELATSVFGRGELVVTVPKDVVNLDGNGVWGGQNGRTVSRPSPPLSKFPLSIISGTVYDNFPAFMLLSSWHMEQGKKRQVRSCGKKLTTASYPIFLF